MAYARLGRHSDIEVERVVDLIVCRRCDLFGPSSFSTRSEALEHLKAHRGAGHKVPDHAFEAMERERAAWGDDPAISLGFDYHGEAGGICRFCLLAGWRLDVRFDDGDRALAHLLHHAIRGHRLPGRLETLVERARDRELDVVHFCVDADGHAWCLGCRPNEETGRYEDVPLSEEVGAPWWDQAVRHLRRHSSQGDPLSRTAMRYLRKHGIRGDLTKPAQQCPRFEDEW